MQFFSVNSNINGLRLKALARAAFLVLISTSLLACAYVTRVSVTPTPGVEPDGRSIDPVASHTGRYVAFASDAENLVAGDANNAKDIFVRDNRAETTELISESIFGGSANGVSGQPDITADGRYVVYWSFADDLVPNDTNAASDVFRYDRQTGTTERVSVATGGTEASGSALGGSVSDDGRYIVFYSTASMDPVDTNGNYDIYKRDMVANTTILISKNLSGNAAGGCFEPVISRDGDSVIFSSTTSDITAGDTNGFSDVFGVNATFGLTINLTHGGDGHSYTGDLGTGFLPTVALVSSATNLDPNSVDTNGVQDIYVMTWTGTTYFTNRITDGDQSSFNPVLAVSAPIDGTTVAFNSAATNLQEPGAQPLDTNGLTDVYLWENTPATPGGSRTRLMSQTILAQVADGASGRRPAISSNGQAIAFPTRATNLAAEDTNGFEDIYIRQNHVPNIETVTGDLEAGETKSLYLTGEFRPGAYQALLLGGGVENVTVNYVGYIDMSITIEMAASATPGPRTLWIYNDAPDLGMPAPLGTGANVEVVVLP